MSVYIESMRVHTKTLVGIVFAEAGNAVLELNLVTQRGSETSILEVVRDGEIVGRLEGVLTKAEADGLRKLDTFHHTA